ncbi:MAG TPA: ribosome small subunit-dependent GTPase A [Paludibacter sp.]|nr:ribosome small subunit-dependent GTPase A [Paludibacter sp.]
MTGLVVKNTGSWYQVKADDGELVECKIKGHFRIQEIRTTNPIAVGDRVDFDKVSGTTGMIHAIRDRRNYIIRRSSNLSKQAHILAANLDLVALIVTVNYPETSTVFIDRFLATAEAYHVPACLVFNKIDLYSDKETAEMNQLVALYSSLGYPVFCISALHDRNLEELKRNLAGKTTLFSGNSGVGKSTLINAIVPHSMARTAEISSYHNKGMHTTTFSEMFEIEPGSHIIDTPGIKGFGTIDMEEAEVGHYFKEIFAISKKCKFGNCTHVHEPGCVVIRAVEQHEITPSRYQSYLSVLSDCHEGKYR